VPRPRSDERSARASLFYALLRRGLPSLGH